MKFLANILAKAGLIVDGTTQLNTIANATIDTDRFLVSDGGVVKYRTGAQLLSDIGPITTSTLKHQVKLGENIAKGQAVYVSSADGTNMIVSKASNTSEATSSKTLGLLETGGTTNAQVNVITEGLLAGLDTSTATAGDPVWLGTNGNLIFGLVNKPYAPAHLVFIGIVTRVQQNNGEIFVKVQNGFELQEIHNVSALNPTNNDGIFYNSSTQLWEKKSIPTVLGYTPANAARVLTINGVSYDLTADRTWSVGTVTSVAALTLGTSGTDLSSSVANGTTTPVITLNVPTASATNRGALSSADWTTFNNKQNAITLTTTGSSGSSTLVGATLNIPTYTLAGLGGISLTSLSAFVPLIYNNTTGQFSIIQSNSTNDGYLSATDWTTFNGKVGGSGTSGQVSYFNGTNSITSSPTFAFTPTSQLLVNNSVTASSAIARGINATPSLTAAANNDVLVGLDINPTFTTGAFTGVSNIGLRVGSSTSINVIPSSTTPYISIGDVSVSNSAFALDVNRASSQLRIQSRTGTNNAYAAFQNTGGAFYIGIDNSTGGFTSTATPYTGLFWYTGSNPMVWATSNSERMRLFGNGNLAINTTTDAGFRLDVNGTARTQQQHTFLQGTSLDATSASYFHSVPTGGSTYGGLALRNQTQDYTGYIFTGRSGAQNAIAFTHTTFAGTPSGSGVTISQLFKEYTTDLGNGNNPHTVTIWSSTSGSPTITNSLVLRGNLNTTNTGHAIAWQHITSGLAAISSASIQSIKQNLTSTSITTSMRFLTISDGANTLSEKMRITDAGTFQTNASVTAASSLAQGASVINTLVAAANNDVLVGLDINPTFTNGAFTGVTNYAIRTVGNSISLFNGGISSGQGFANTSIGLATLSGVGNALIRMNANSTSNASRIEYQQASTTRWFGGINTNSDFSISTDGGISNGLGIFLSTRNVVIGQSTDAGFKLDVNGTARVQGQLTITTNGASITGGITATSNGHRFGNIQVLTSGGPTNTGVGMTCVAAERDLEFYGGGAAAGANMFSFNHWNGQTIGVTNVDRSIVRIYSGFTDGNINNLSGNHLWLSPTYNFAGTRTGIIVRGIYYNPTLTSLTNTTHRAIETETGDVVFGSTSGNVMIGTTTAGGRFTIQSTNNQVGMAISGSSLTGSNAQSLVSLSQTWNTTGNPTAFLLNITNTASGATSDLMDLQVGGASRFEITAAGRARLGAYGSGTITGTATYNLAVDASGNVIEVTGGGGGGGIGGSGTTNYLSKFTASTTLGNSQLFDNGTVTFLGNGDVNATPSTGIFSGTGGTGTNIAGAELRIRGGASTGNAAGGPITFYTSTAGTTGSAANAATERMRLSAGNFLINQTTSLTGVTNSVELTGVGNTDGTQQAIYSVFANHGTFAANTGYFVFNKSRGTTAGSVTAVASGDRLGMIRWNGADGTAQIRAAEIYSEVDGTPGTNDMPGRIVFATTLDGASSPTERMRITNSGTIGVNTQTIGSTLQINGNAAIGYNASTAAPTNGLAVAGNVGIGTNTVETAANYTTLQVNGTTGAWLRAGTSAYGSYFSAIPIVDVLVIAVNRNPFDGVYTNTSKAASEFRLFGANGDGYITFSTINTNNTTPVERMRINNTGSVFIGNGETAASPTLGIISGTGGTGTNIAGAEFRIRGGASTGSAAGGPITFYTSAAGTAGTSTNAAVERMRITTSGSVGIGTNNPTGDFEVRGATNTVIRVSSTGNFPLFQLRDDRATVAEWNIENGRVSSGTLGFYYATGNATRMIITSAGNVGIQTTTVGSALQVNGGAAIGYSASTAAPTNGLAVAGDILGAGNVRSSNGTVNMAISWQTGPTYGIVGTFSNHDVSVWTNGSQKMLISTGGQVTLNTGANVSAIAQTGYSLTGANAQSLIDLAGTWNTTGNPTAIKLNITNTASGTGADLMELQVGGVNQFVVGKSGSGYFKDMLTVEPQTANTSAIKTDGYSLTGSNAQSLLAMTGTWNTTGNPTAISLNITNTASGANAYLMDLQVGSATQFRVTKAGAIRTAAPTTGTANDWKLGTRVASSMAFDATQYLEVEVGGTLYRVALATLA